MLRSRFGAAKNVLRAIFPTSSQLFPRVGTLPRYAAGMDKTEGEAHPRYRTTFFFVATMLGGIIIGWVAMLLLLMGRY